MKPLFLLPALVAATLPAQTVVPALANFPDGTAVEIHSEATGPAQLSSHGSVGIGPGIGKQDMVHRVVTDSANNVLFAYILEASRGASPDTVMIRIDPLTAAMDAEMRSPSGYFRVSGPHVPTVAAVHEFSAVRLGQVVTLDILHNPATGVTIYDVLRPLTGKPGVMSVSPGQARDELSLRDITVKVNNHAVPAPAAWTIADAVRIDIPGHGAYVIAVHEPHLPPIYAFSAVGRADGKTLRWTMDGSTVEITSLTNVLTQAAGGVLWLYHDAKYRSPDQPNTVKLQTAETVDWLIPKK